MFFEDTSFNHKYDSIVPKERLQGISQHHNMSIGEECEFSISYEGISSIKKDRKEGASPVNWAKTDSLEKMIFNNVMLKQ